MTNIPVDAIERLSKYNASYDDVPYTMIGPTGYGYVIQMPAVSHDISVTAHWIADLTATLVVSPDNSASQIRALTQAEYDALVAAGDLVHDALYVIVGN